VAVGSYLTLDRGGGSGLLSGEFPVVLQCAFMCSGSDHVPGGRCLVVWPKVTRPVELGGLDVSDLSKMGYALRMRWEWLALDDPDRSWALLPSKPEAVVQAMFEASVTVVVGDGARVLFWTDGWLDGCSVMQLAPNLVTAVSTWVRKACLVCDALSQERWIMTFQLSVRSRLERVCQLWARLQSVQLQVDMPDQFLWRWTSYHKHSSSSAYHAFFIGQSGIPGAGLLFKARAPPTL
jgi:hypothetical protein